MYSPQRQHFQVFGASNVSELLSNVSINYRHEAAVTIFYEAQARLSDPVYDCVSTILALQQQVAAMQAEVSTMQTELMNRRFAGANTAPSSHSFETFQNSWFSHYEEDD
ncbi:LOB domain-containing protein 20 [Trifolium repens]|nr:LOB domain-containing protein 20 [Trifolium repens]